MESAKDNVCSMNSAPYPRLPNTTCNSSELCVDESHDSNRQSCPGHLIPASLRAFRRHYLSTCFIRDNTDCDLSAAIHECFDRDIVANDVNIQHRNRSKTLRIILICHFQILTYSFLSIRISRLTSTDRDRIISSMTICASAEYGSGFARARVIIPCINCANRSGWFSAASVEDV
jgi:hypothetical protein